MIDDGKLGDAARLMAEAFGNGPFRDFAEESGRIIMRKLEERGMKGIDPEAIPPELADQMLRSAWIEAAITSFPCADPDQIVADLNRLFDMMMMDRLANADGGDTPQ